MRGVVGISSRTDSTRSKQSSIVTPFWSAMLVDSCITGPSAKGSLKGIPSSIMSAPFSTRTGMIFVVISSLGNQEVMYLTKPVRPVSLIDLKVSDTRSTALSLNPVNLH